MAASKFHAIRASPTWALYEVDRITESECYALLCLHHFPELTPEAIATAIAESRKGIRINYALLSTLQDIKNASNGQLRVVGVANIPQPEWVALHSRRHWKIFWTVFDKIFLSWTVGAHLAELSFLEHIENALELESSRAIFVDLNLENVLAAKSRGMKGLRFSDTKETVRILMNSLGDAVKRGNDFLRKNSKRLVSVTQEGLDVHDNHSQLLILDATGKEGLVFFEEHSAKQTWAFLMRSMKHSLEDLRDDVDTTALACLLLQSHGDAVESVLDRIRSTTTYDDVIGSHFSNPSPIADPVTCVNVLRLFYANGRGEQLHKTWNYVLDVFWNRAYIGGTPRYPHPEAFLYSLTRLVVRYPDNYELFRLTPNLKIRLREFVGFPTDALAFAMKAMALELLGLDSGVYTTALKEAQCEDGGWAAGTFCTYGEAHTRLGSRGVATAFAVKALSTCQAKAHEVEEAELLAIGGPADKKDLEDLEERIRDLEALEDTYADTPVSGDVRLVGVVNEDVYEAGVRFEKDILAIYDRWAPFLLINYQLFVGYTTGVKAETQHLLWVSGTLLGRFATIATRKYRDAVVAGVKFSHYAILHDWILFGLLAPLVSTLWLEEPWYITTTITTALHLAVLTIVCFTIPRGSHMHLGSIARGIAYMFSKAPYLALYAALRAILQGIRQHTGVFFVEVEVVS
jgi:FMN phosphatase YigB (HAD superfamily)